MTNENTKHFPDLHNFNDMYTPDCAVDVIAKYLPLNKTYWEACYGMGHMADALLHRGFKVVGDRSMNCLTSEPIDWDVWITNPPFNGNKKFVRRAIQLGKPFVFLMRLEHLGGVEASELFGNIDFSILIPKKRINYITPKIMRGEKTGGSSFHSIWILHGIQMPKQINYEQ